MKNIEFTQVKNTYSMICRVQVRIRANADIVWSLLTDAEGFPRWNSTVTGIDGHIREGQRITVHVPGTNRTFRPRVLDVVANRRMTWNNGLALIFKGSRTFELRPYGNNATDFIMEERFRGLIFALVKNSLPDFRPIFESYAHDLKNEAERAKSVAQ